MTWRRQRETRRNLSRVERRLEASPDDPMLHMRRAHLLESLNRAEAALRELRHAGRLFVSRHMYRHARAAYQMVLDRKDQDVVAVRALQTIDDCIDGEEDPVASFPPAGTTEDDSEGIEVIVDLTELALDESRSSETDVDPWDLETPVDLWRVTEAAERA